MKLIVQDGTQMKTYPITGWVITGSFCIAHGTRGDFVLGPGIPFYINGVDENAQKTKGIEKQ